VVELLKRLARATLGYRYSFVQMLVFMCAYGALVRGSIWWWLIILIVGSFAATILETINEGGTFNPKDDDPNGSQRRP